MFEFLFNFYMFLYQKNNKTPPPQEQREVHSALFYFHVKRYYRPTNDPVTYSYPPKVSSHTQQRTEMLFYQTGYVFADPMLDPKQTFWHINDYTYPIYLLAYNWFYFVYEIPYYPQQVVFVYVFHIRVDPFFPDADFYITRRCKIDITSVPIKDSLHLITNSKRPQEKQELPMYRDFNSLYFCFQAEIWKRSHYLYEKHARQTIEEDTLFLYDSYAIFMYTCPKHSSPNFIRDPVVKKSPRKLIVVEESSKPVPKTRGHGIIKIYPTNLSLLRL